MQQPLISVIINNYNYARFLPQAIESALAQTYPHKEIIVVDDGSTDNSREVLCQYEGRVKLILKENGGQASAFNVGFTAAQGEIVCFLDSDDYWAPQLLERLAAMWRPEYAIVLWWMQSVDEVGQPLARRFPWRTPMVGDLRPRLLRYMHYPSVPTSGNAFSRRALEAILPLDESVWRISADLPLVVAAPFYGEVGFIDETLTYYRVHGGNLHYGMPANWQRLEREVNHAMRREPIIREHAARQGLKPHPRLGYTMPVMNLARLLLLLAGRKVPIVSNDTLLKLAIFGTEGIWKHDEAWSIRERIGWSRPFWIAFVNKRRAAELAARRVFWNASEADIQRFLDEAF